MTAAAAAPRVERRAAAADARYLAVPGFRASGVSCGIKPNQLDLALIASEVPAVVAGVFTRSALVGAPVELCRERARRGRARGVVVNSGIANVAMGARGKRDAAEMARLAAAALDAPEQEMLVASTGVIGEPLPMLRIRQGVSRAATALSESGFRDAARAIMTTDSFPKSAFAQTRIAGRSISLLGIAKGSGMIEPDLATMLAFVVTDAAITPAHARHCLRRAAADSFNKLTIDGEGSTSDTLLLLANGVAGNAPLRGPSSPGAVRFAAALGKVTQSLARDLARDGEGATKLIVVKVSGARTAAEADRAARRIANSMLVKTAMFGNDPNWGRILQTLGASQVRMKPEQLEVKLCGVPVFRRGASAGPAARRRAATRLRAKEVEIAVQLGAGRAATQLWTCDLSYNYVRINAEYTT